MLCVHHRKAYFSYLFICISQSCRYTLILSKYLFINLMSLFSKNEITIPTIKSLINMNPSIFPTTGARRKSSLWSFNDCFFLFRIRYNLKFASTFLITFGFFFLFYCSALDFELSMILFTFVPVKYYLCLDDSFIFHLLLLHKNHP